jgi:hypothetical protein
MPRHKECYSQSVVHAELKGLVQAGKQSIANSELRLYARGSIGDGSDSTELLSQPFHTDGNGEFSLSVASACPSPTSQVNLVAKGGNPSLRCLQFPPYADGSPGSMQ